jgi:rod shape-determining protein MreB
MIEEGLAAAIGAGVDVEDKRAVAVIDLGGDSTNIAIVALGMIVYSRAERTGSRDIDRAISERLRRFRSLAIGSLTAERLKIELASATEPVDGARSISVKGRDVTTGAPIAINVTAEEIYAVAQPVLHKIVGAVRNALAELPPEVAADIYDRGLIVTGGGAQLEGLGEFLQRETSLSTRVAEEPRYASVRGLAQLFDEPLLLRRVTRNEQSLLLDSEAFEAT